MAALKLAHVMARTSMVRSARALRRRFLPEHVRADIRDYEVIVELMARTLAPDSQCLDVGAHAGLFVREMVRLAPRARHIAWEPLPEYAAQLRRRFPSVDVREFALSARVGSTEFQRSLDDPGWSGFMARPTPRGDRFEAVTVRTERLDDLLATGIRPAFIKIDVEGAEEGVLLGGLETIRRHRPTIVFEHADDAGALYGTTPEALHRLFRGELDYTIGGLHGDGPYDEAEFVATVRRGKQHNFVATPIVDRSAGLPRLAHSA